MGMYTELNLGICFKSDAPKDFIDAIVAELKDQGIPEIGNDN